MILYDEFGDVVENALTAEEYQEKLDAEVETKTNERIEELKAQGTLSDEEKEELQKLRDKDLNFKNLRDKTEEKDKEAKTWKEQAEALKQQIEDLSGKFAEKTTAEVEDWKNEGLKILGVHEDDMDKFNQIFDNDLKAIEPKTKEEFLAKMQKASRLIPSNEANPVLVGNSLKGRTSESSKSFAETEEGKKLAEQLGCEYTKQDNK